MEIHMSADKIAYFTTMAGVVLVCIAAYRGAN
jgi:hypothetical protein